MNAQSGVGTGPSNVFFLAPEIIKGLLRRGVRGEGGGAREGGETARRPHNAIPE